MQYFGVPKCPYCKKRVNLIRTWSLKRQGEYKCPRCEGISNIFLSPLIYVFALLAVFAGGAVYFFHKFVLDDISLSTVLQVLIPFAVFFLLSLFLVYLAKPVIKKIPKAELKKRGRRREDFESRRQAPQPSEPMFYDDQEYLPRMDYRTGPLPPTEDDGDMKVLPPIPPKPAVRGEMEKTSVVDLPESRPRSPRVEPQKQVPRPAAPTAEPRRAARAVRQEPAVPRAAETVARRSRTVEPSPAPAVPRAENAVRPSRTVTSVDVPSVSNEDFFAKYDDPEYVERRLRELKGQRGDAD